MAVFTTAAVAGVLGVASSSFLASVSAFALNAAVGIGLSMAARALNKADQPQAAGVRGKMQSGGDVPRSFLMGARATAGSLVYANFWGEEKKTPNAYLTQVIALSDVPIGGVTAMWVNGSPVTVRTVDGMYRDWGYPVEEFVTDKGGNHLWVKFYDGTQTVADPLLVGTVSSAARPYEATRVGRGCAYAVVTSQANSSLFSGFPSFRFEVAGMPLYDPSQDTSVGGVGPHRWSDRSTWGGDGDNLPAVQVYNLLRGISYDGSWLYGLQTLSPARLPVADWIAQINKCRALVTGPSGPEAQYLTGIEVSVDTELTATIDAIMKGAHGRLIEVGGIYKPMIGAPSAPVLTFSDLDILSTETQSGKPFASLANSINGVTASYPEPMEAWNTKPAPPLFNTAYEARDGQRRLVVDLPMETVSRNSQVQRIMEAALAEARRERRHTFTLPPFAWPIEPGDVVVWSSVRNGYLEKQFRVEGVSDKANLDVMLDVVEVDPGDYHFGGTYVPPIFTQLDPHRPDASVIDGWAAEPWTITDASSTSRRPAIKVSAADDLDDVLSVHIVARVKATGTVVFDSSSTPYAPPFEWILSGNWCLPATSYEIKGREIPYSGRETEWSEWIVVTTPDIRVSLEDLSADIIDKLEELQEWIDADLFVDFQALVVDVNETADKLELEQQERINDALRDAARFRSTLGDIDTLRDYIADVDYAGFSAREEIRRTLSVKIEENYAQFDERINVAVSDTAGISERLTTFEVDVGGINSRIDLVETASVNGLDALAHQIALITVGTDNQFDPAVLWTFDASTQGWTGNGTPTASGGFLRPANHASDPYVISPVDLAIAGSTYSQTRARIKKTGTLTWDGYVWWKAVGDTTWDVSRRVAVSEPSYDGNGIGLLTFNMTWTGTIAQIRLDLSTVQDASNFFTIDWISIGSPSPGASRAEIVAERTARIAADSAMAEDIVVIEATINDPATGLTATAGGLTVLESVVEIIDDIVSGHSTALTDVIAGLADKASIEALNELTAEFEAIGGGGIVSQGEAITAIRNQLLANAGDLIDEEFATFLGKMDAFKATADASQTLSTRIELTNESLDIVSKSVALVQAKIPDLASAAALLATSARVSVTEGLLSAQGDAMARVKADLGWNDALAEGARAVALSNIRADVTLSYNLANAKSKVYRQTSAPAGTTEVPLRAGDIWFDSDDGNRPYRYTGSAWGDVTDVRLTANAGDIDSIKAELNWNDSGPVGGKSQALSALTANVQLATDLAEAKSKVYTQTTAPTGTTAVPLRTNDLWFESDEGFKPRRWNGSAWIDITDARIIASAEALTEIEAEVGETSADARFRMSVVTGAPTGYARIAAQARYNSGSGTFRTAGFYIDVPADDDEPTSFLIDANRFAVRNGTEKILPFVVSGGEVRMNVAHIGTVNAGIIQSSNGKMVINVNNGTIEIFS